jgi:polyhydroxyalkanoic acid synthase PhaR subunit
MEVWEHWYDAASKGWSRAMNGSGSKPVYPDPLSFYQTWLKSVTNVQEQFKSSAGDPLELWNRWFETTTEAWRKAIEAGGIGGDLPGLMTQWMEMMEEARARLLAGAKLPADPFTFFRQWYDATNATLSTIVGDVIGTEKFMQVSSEFLKSYAGLYATLRRANEEYFRNLQLPTRTDIARVAELVVNLEDKVDHIDGQLEDFEDAVGSGLSQFPVVLQKLEAVEHLEQLVGSLEERLDHRVGNLEKRLDERVGGLEKGLEQQVGSLEKRLDGVEGKLDALLAALEKLSARESEPVASPQTTRRASRKSGTQSQKSGGDEAQAAS